MRALRRLRYIAAFVCGVLLPPYANAQESIIYLSCAGQLEFNTDAKREVKPSIVSVALDVNSNALQISDLWGCLLDMAPSTSERSGGLSCKGPLPVKVNDQEVSFALERTGAAYATRTTLTLNRYTGSLSVRSLAVALPAAKASWINFIAEGTYACSKQQRKF